MRTRRTSLIAYTLAHFCVDFACFFLLYRGFVPVKTPEAAWAGFLVYNCVAFGLQAPLGYFCDRRQGFPAGILGCVLTAAGLCLVGVPWLGLIVCAIGNALFHTGGGIDSLVHANGKLARSGVFVSSGALGVALGTLAGKAALPLIAPVLMLLMCTALILFFALPAAASNEPFSGRPLVSSLGVGLSVLCVAVCIRAYGGTLIQTPWRAEYLLLPAWGAALGKAFGGILADYFGARRVGALSLLACIPLLVFGYQSPLLCTLGMLLFNINMPITLCAVSDRLPGYPGLSFGLTTLALLLGSLFPFFFLLAPGTALIVLPLLCIASAGGIALAAGGKR